MNKIVNCKHIKEIQNITYEKNENCEVMKKDVKNKINDLLTLEVEPTEEENKVVEIKVVGNIDNFKNKTIEDIKEDYRNLKIRYEKSESLMLSDRYKNVLDTLEKLESDYDVKLVSGTKELIKIIRNNGALLGDKKILFKYNTKNGVAKEVLNSIDPEPDPTKNTIKEEF